MWVIGALTSLFSKLSGFFTAFQWGRERTLRKEQEEDIRRANDLEDKADEAKKRSADDKRPVDDRLRQHGRLRD